MDYIREQADYSGSILLDNLYMPRNREFMRVFKDIGLVEQLGSGMSRILKAYDRSAFDLSEHFVVVSSPYPEGISPQVTPQVTPQVEGLDEMSVHILGFCAEPKSKKELLELCGLKDRKNLTQTYIDPLLQKKLLQLTIPDKPTSSKQKYETTDIGKEVYSTPAE